MSLSENDRKWIDLTFSEAQNDIDIRKKEKERNLGFHKKTDPMTRLNIQAKLAIEDFADTATALVDTYYQGHVRAGILIGEETKKMILSVLETRHNLYASTLSDSFNSAFNNGIPAVTREALKKSALLNLGYEVGNATRKLELAILEQERNLKNANAPQSGTAGVINIDFAFMADNAFRVIVERDYKELQSLRPENSPKSILVISGGIIEGLLTDALIKKGTWTFDECRARQLNDIIYRAKADGIIVHDNIANVVKTFRNLIHPAREIKDNLVFNNTHAINSRSAVDVIIDDVKRWHVSNP